MAPNYNRKRLQPIQRVFDVARICATGHLTRRQIADRVGVHERTVRRAIDALRDLGIDVQQVESLDPGRALRYYLDPDAWAAVLSLPD